jgi:hypothetical protein
MTGSLLTAVLAVMRAILALLCSMPDRRVRVRAAMPAYAPETR